MCGVVERECVQYINLIPFKEGMFVKHVTNHLHHSNDKQSSFPAL